MPDTSARRVPSRPFAAAALRGPAEHPGREDTTRISPLTGNLGDLGSSADRFRQISSGQRMHDHEREAHMTKARFR